MSAVTLSTGAVLAVTGLLGAMASAVGVLFWALIASKNDQIKQSQADANDKVKREREITDRLTPSVEENTRTIKRWIEIQESLLERERRVEYRELPPPSRTRRTERE